MHNTLNKCGWQPIIKIGITFSTVKSNLYKEHKKRHCVLCYLDKRWKKENHTMTKTGFCFWFLILILDFITWYLLGFYSNATLRWSWGTAPWAWRALIGLFEHRCPQTRSSGEHESPTARSLQPRDFPQGKRWEKSTQTEQSWVFTSSPLSGAQALLVSLGISTQSWGATHGESLPKFSRSCPSFLPQIHEAASWRLLANVPQISVFGPPSPVLCFPMYIYHISARRNKLAES